MQAVQTGLWSKSGQLATRAGKPWRGHLKNRHRRKYPASDRQGKVLSFGPFECVIPKRHLFLALRPTKLSGSSTEHLTEMTRQMTLVKKAYSERNFR